MERISSSEATTVQASADEKWIYYSTESVAEAGGLWRLPAAGGEPVVLGTMQKEVLPSHEPCQDERDGNNEALLTADDALHHFLPPGS